MKFMPGDDPLHLPGPIVGTMARLLVEDWLAENADHRQLIAEAEELLNAVDLAISGADFAGDEDGELMQRCWAFIGPGLHQRIRQMNFLPLRKQHLYTQIAVVTMVLTTRRQTLELNGIEVLKSV